MIALLDIEKNSDTRKIAEVRGAGHKGRGLFAVRDIGYGEVIDKAAGLFFTADQSEPLLQTAVFPHLLANPMEFGIKGEKSSYALTMGDMSFCNHALPNNAVIEWSFDKLGLWLTLRALQNIGANEEITIRYTNLGEYDTTIFDESRKEEN
jgi:uncharacterized protein